MICTSISQCLRTCPAKVQQTQSILVMFCVLFKLHNVGVDGTTPGNYHIFSIHLNWILEALRTGSFGTAQTTNWKMGVCWCYSVRNLLCVSSVLPLLKDDFGCRTNKDSGDGTFHLASPVTLESLIFMLHITSEPWRLRPFNLYEPMRKS